MASISSISARDLEAAELLTIVGDLGGRQAVVSQEKSPLVAQKILKQKELEDIAFSPKSNHYRDAAYTLTILTVIAGVLGLINPIFFAAALIFLCAAVICGTESTTTAFKAEEAKSRLMPIWRAIDQEEAAGEARLTEAEIEKLLPVSIVENGQFKPDEFQAMMERNRDGSLRAFSSYNEAIAYPYTIPGVEKNEDESAPDAIFKHFAKQAIGSDMPEFVQECLNNNEESGLQNKARHICGFLKLLGDGNNPVNADIAIGIFEKNREVALDAVALKTGKLTTFCSKEQIGDSPIIYSVQGDEVGLYNAEDIAMLPQAERQSIARYETSRTVTVFPPDQDGNVRYTINRIFIRI